MLIEIEKTCFDRDQRCEEAVAIPYLDERGDRWHPALRLLVIAGSATALWMLLLAVIA